LEEQLKLVNAFTDFLRETVNLNQTRIGYLNENIEALQNFVRQCDWEPKVRRFEEQGSWAHDTIIKPVDGGEFDADLLVFVDPVDGWSAADYVAKLGKAFADSKTYGDKVKTWNYCVTITYAGERKVDIAPCVVGRLSEGSLEVCNRSADAFERSEPIEYTTWLKERNTYSGSNSFRKVTRLLKYLRDIKQTFSCPSVLLTTLLGYQINWFDKDTDPFADTPTTLRTVMGRLDDSLQAQVAKPRVENPKLSCENFADAWTDAQYSNFRNFVHKYREWIDEAYDIEGRPESIKAWRRVFGDDFAKGEEVRVAKSLPEGMATARSLLMTSAAHLDGLVDVVRNFGLAALPADFNRPPHMRPPPWRQAATISSNVSVSARWQSARNAAQSRPVRAGEILPARGGLWFDVRVNSMEPVPQGYSVKWRITNTGAVALALKAGRGDFYSPTTGSRRWESLEYRGVHIAEAFIIRMSDDLLVGQSPPFNVVIE
jgi:hypothetical protein